MKREKNIVHVISISLLFGPRILLAYEIETHAILSEAAAQASILSDNSQNGVLRSLGLTYPIHDLTGKQWFPNSKGVRQDIQGLIAEGARFEDDGSRATNHFYDPLRNRPLSVPLLSTRTSPDWALEDTAVVDKQAFSYRDARGYLYKGLTLSTTEDREKNLGSTFQALGQAIHHLQDMAQPQHVRLDEHCDRIVICGLTGRLNPSRYERYTLARQNREGLPAGNYAAPQAETPRAFWHTGDRKGIADYTNRGFVSAGTITSAAFPEPTFNGAEAIDVRALFSAATPAVPVPWDCNSDAHPCFMTFLQNTVVDAHTGESKANKRAATLSIFDQDLRASGRTVTVADPISGTTVITDRVFSLNRFNFDAAHDFLIPRAVGYSTGLIDYFFRGKIDMDVDYDSTTVGQYRIENKGDEDMKGSFTLYYDGVDGNRYPLPNDGLDVTWRNVTVPKGGASVSLIPPPLPASPNPLPKRPDEYFLVFKGEMGAETPPDAQSVGAVAAKNKLKLLWEPWRVNLADNRPWAAEAGTVNNQAGPNTQTVEDGRLVLFAGAGGAGGVSWQAATADDYVESRYMKIRTSCSGSAFTENWNVYGFITVGPRMFTAQTIAFAGGSGPNVGSGYYIPRSTAMQETIVDLGRIGFFRVGWISIQTIGFDTSLTCSVDYIDFSDKAFEKVAPEAVYIP